MQIQFEGWIKNPYAILFGGTFNPTHIAHVALAEKLYKIFQQPITLLPTNIPPYKPKPTTTTHERLHMLELAFGTDQRFLIDTREINQDKYSCTYQTLQNFRKEIGLKNPIFFLIGSDSLITLNTWDYWQELFSLTNFIVAPRPNYDETRIINQTLLHEITTRKINLKLNEQTIKEISNNIKPAGNIYMLDYAPMDVSSTIIRQLIAGRESITHLVPKRVAQYITTNNLYALNL